MQRLLPFAHYLCKLVLVLVSLPIAAWSSGSDQDSVLHSIPAIKSLSAGEAALGQPVEIEGVVTFVDGLEQLFLEKDEQAIFIRRKDEAPNVIPGALVKMRGKTMPGDYAPVMVSQECTVLGMPGLPKPARPSYEQMISGTFDGRWAEIEGIVRSVRRTGRVQTITIESNAVEMSAIVYRWSGATPGIGPDAFIKIRGAVGTRFNGKRQIAGNLLLVASNDQIEVVEPAPADPFAVPEVRAGTLLQFENRERFGRAVRVSGIILGAADEKTVFLRDHDGSPLCIQLTDPARIQRGSWVEAIGFPAMGIYSPVLKAASFRLTGASGYAEPRKTTPDALVAGEHDSDLVVVEALLVNAFRDGDEDVLLLQRKNVVFQARVPATASRVIKFQFGSLLRITGISMVTGAVDKNGRQTPQSFRIQVRDPGDVAVIRSAPWLTTQRLAFLFFATVVAGSIAALWIAILRRQVKTQTQTIAESLRRESAREERTRIAREFHDHLEQLLTAVSFQMDTARHEIGEIPTAAQNAWQLAREMVTYSQVEVQRAVLDLRSPSLKNRSLSSALEHAIARICPQLEVRTEVIGQACHIDPMAGHHLLRIAEEFAANAVRHGNATLLSIRLEFLGTSLRMKLVDNGTGFQVSADAVPAFGHFGIVGMRERALKMDGELRLASTPGGGVNAELSIPLTPV